MSSKHWRTGLKNSSEKIDNLPQKIWADIYINVEVSTLRVVIKSLSGSGSNLLKYINWKTEGVINAYSKLIIICVFLKLD